MDSTRQINRIAIQARTAKRACEERSGRMERLLLDLDARVQDLERHAPRPEPAEEPSAGGLEHALPDPSAKV